MTNINLIVVHYHVAARIIICQKRIKSSPDKTTCNNETKQKQKERSTNTLHDPSKTNAILYLNIITTYKNTINCNHIFCFRHRGNITMQCIFLHTKVVKYRSWIMFWSFMDNPLINDLSSCGEDHDHPSCCASDSDSKYVKLMIGLYWMLIEIT